MTIGPAPDCFSCKHLFYETAEEKAGRDGRRCTAFPTTKIPDDIFWSEFKHDKEHPEQEVPGIVFEPKE
jgi:hypothetical protein